MKLATSMRVTEALGYTESRNTIAYDYVVFFEKLGHLLVLIPNNTKKRALSLPEPRVGSP